MTENVLITACEDGAIRAVHLYPHRFLGTVGHHSGDSIERLDVSAAGDIVASVSHDAKIKFWNISYLENMEYNKTRKPFFNRWRSCLIEIRCLICPLYLIISFRTGQSRRCAGRTTGSRAPWRPSTSCPRPTGPTRKTSLKNSRRDSQ